MISGVRPNSARVMTRVFSSKPAFLQVVQERGHDVVELGDHFLMGLEVLAVAIPPGPGHADERDAGLDQPAGDQRLLAELGRPELVADLLRLTRDIEERLAGHQAPHPLIGDVVAAQRARRPSALEPPAQELAKLGALEVVKLGDLVEPVEVLGDHARGQIHRLVALAEEAARAGRHHPPFGGRVERDVIGHPALDLTELASQDGAQVGVSHAGVVAAPVHHQPGPAAVVADLGIERADDAGFVEPLGHLGHELGDLDAGNGRRDRAKRAAGGRARLGVPGLELARPAGQPEQDDSLFIPLELAGQRRLL